MPIYAYRCSSCGHAKDVLQKMSDAPLSDCPKCLASTFSKQLTAAGFQLKGGGWYATDFKGGGSSKPALSSSESPSPSTDGAASSSSADAPAAASSSTPCGGSCACH